MSTCFPISDWLQFRMVALPGLREGPRSRLAARLLHNDNGAVLGTGCSSNGNSTGCSAREGPFPVRLPPALSLRAMEMG